MNNTINFWVILCLFFGLNLQAQTYDIRDFGAVANDDKMDTPAIQSAIDRCYQAGGGEVLVSAGTYHTGSLRLRSKVYLHLSSTAQLIGSTQQADYPDPKYPHLIFADSATQTGITGKGTIDGQGLAFFDQSKSNWRPLNWRPHPWIIFYNCDQVQVTDVQLLNSPAHVLVTQLSNNVTIRGISIHNDPRSPNTDGIDIKGGERIRISDCYISTGDDAICLKSAQDTIRELIVHDCVLKSDDAALKFGTGSRHLITDCHFRNINIYDTRYGIAFFMTQGGAFRSSFFDNINIQTGGRHAFTFPIFMDNERRDNTYSNGQIEQVHFSNLRIHSAGNVLVSGQTDANLRHLSFRAINWTLPNIYPIPKRKRQKPRGNKDYVHDPSAVDLSNVNAHFVFGYIDGLEMESVNFYYENTEVEALDDRQLIYKKKVKPLKAKKLN